MELRPSLFCPFFCLLYFFLPPFKDLGCFSGCLMSSAGVQKLFCGIYSAFKCSFDEFVGGESVLPVLLLRHLSSSFQGCFLKLRLSQPCNTVILWVCPLRDHIRTASWWIAWILESGWLRFPLDSTWRQLLDTEQVTALISSCLFSSKVVVPLTP